MTDKENDDKWKKFAQEQADLPPEEEVSIEVAGEEDDMESVDVGMSEEDSVEVNVSDDSLAAVQELQDKIKSLELKMVGYKDQAVRAAAEMDNARRRAERDVSNAHRFGNEKLMKELLPVIDSLVRGQEGMDEKNEQVKSMLDGMVMTLELFESILSKFGLNVISPEKGEAFNPELHEAMSMQPDSDADKNKVLQVLQKGYELNGRVLRAAMVIVSA